MAMNSADSQYVYVHLYDAKMIVEGVGVRMAMEGGVGMEGAEEMTGGR